MAKRKITSTQKDINNHVARTVTIVISNTGVMADVRKETLPDGQIQTRYFIYPQINGEDPFEVECNVAQQVPLEIAALLKPIILKQNKLNTY